MSLESKAKTIVELCREYGKWKQTFARGARGDHKAYDEARDTRRLFEEELWIRLKDVQKEIRKLKDYIDYTNKLENGKRCLSLLGLIGSGLAILTHPIFIWGCITSLGGILLLRFGGF